MENSLAPPQEGNASVGCKPNWQAATAPGTAGGAKNLVQLLGGGGRDSLRKAPPPHPHLSVPAPPEGEPQAPDRLEPGEAGEDDVASVVVPKVEQVAGQGGPQVDAGGPGQQGVLEARSEVWAVCIHRQIGVLGTKGTLQCCGRLLQNPALPGGKWLGRRDTLRATGSEGKWADEQVWFQV